MERELIIDSLQKVRISGLVVKGPNGKLRIENGAKLDLSDSDLSGAQAVRAIGAIDVRRTVFRNCQDACIAFYGVDGNVQVSQSSFTAGAASRIAIDLDQCPVGLEPAANLVGNVFVGFPTAVRVGANFQRSTSIVHQTFHANGVAISYEGGWEHVLLNNVFSGQTAASILGCEGLFALRRDHVLYDQAAADGCLAGDPGVVRADPLFGSAAGGDFRLQWGSPLIDTAPPVPVVGVDVNGAAPGFYFGAGPDYGGRETY